MLFEADAPGEADSTQGFDQQVRARNALLTNVMNFVRRLREFNDVGAIGLSEVIVADFVGGPGTVGGPGMIGSIMYGLDLGFLRGSSRNYSAGERAKFETVEGYKAAGGYIYQDNDANWPDFKEMIGIWNGETRFVANITTTGQRQGVNPDAGGWVVPANANPYTLAKQFGAVDYNEAVAGGFIAHHNRSQLLTGDTNAIDRVEGGDNFRASTSTGDNEPHNNIPPSYGLYIWKRIE